MLTVGAPKWNQMKKLFNRLLFNRSIVRFVDILGSKDADCIKFALNISNNWS